MKNDNQYTEGCPRCDDYDEVVEELKKEKEHRDRESKDALRKCEEKHKKKDAKIQGLQKKILTMTIIAVVGGTLVGKEFVDKIAAYIESFNSVKNAASGLVSASPMQGNEDEKSEKSSQEESPKNSEEKESFLVDGTKKDDLWWDSGVSSLDLIDMTPNYPASSFMLPYEDASLVGLITNSMLSTPMLLENMQDFTPSLSDQLIDFTTFGSEMDLFNIPLWNEAYDINDASSFYSAPAPPAVPETSSWMGMFGVLPLISRRRRRM